MMLRHAAALALAGWYLMRPPLASGWIGRAAYQLGLVKEAPVWVAADAPLSQWELVESFDSAQRCTNAQAQYAQREADILARAYSAFEQRLFDQAIAAQCIATDDPRLKEN